MRQARPTTEDSRLARTEARLRELDRSFNRVVGRQGDGGDGGGPAGPPGADGDPGVSVTSATVNGSGHLILTMSTGATIDAGVVVGATGATGPTGATGATGNPMVAPLFSAVQTASQTGLPSGAFTALLFPTEQVDSHNGHSTSTNTSRWTCPASWAGWYRVSGTAMIVGTSGRRGLAIFKNGVQVTGSLVMHSASPVFDTAVATTKLVQLAVGDYLELRAFQDSGAARDAYADASGYGSGFDVEFVRT